MNDTLFNALLVFALVSSATPGPNNMMLLASGANFGFRKTIPHMLGVSLGHTFLVVVVGLGLAGLFVRIPQLRQLLAVLAFAYMIWLAWKIANAGEPKKHQSSAKPFTFLQAAAFQWVNPKGWVMAITAQTAYAHNDTAIAALIVGAGFLSMNLPAITLWAWLGQEMRRFLTNPIRLRLFNWTMAVLLVLSLVPVFWSEF